MRTVSTTLSTLARVGMAACSDAAGSAPTVEAGHAADAGGPGAGHDAPGADAAEPVVDAVASDAPANALDGGGSVSLGGRFDPASGVYSFAVRSKHATRIVVDLFAAPLGETARLEVTLANAPGSDVWSTTLSATAVAAAGVGSTVYYGYRAWGPNWPYDPTWTPGSNTGFVSAWDAAGNTFDPNKLLIDPYTHEISHDPLTPGSTDGSLYSTTAGNLAKDSAPAAPKSVVFAPAALDTGTKPTRPLSDDIVYEVHVRGLTENDPTTTTCKGTYAAAAAKASWLTGLGITAIELLPVMETQNDLNDASQSTTGMNYWGYSTLADFTVDRRYACDQTPGGPTREFAALVKAMHSAGIKVFLDVVYNHTAEGGGHSLYSWRGLDNASYYELSSSAQAFVDETGIGANFNVADPMAADLVVDSLHYFATDLGVDGFRFDEAAELGNKCTSGCFTFDATRASGLLQRIAASLPGTALIAEPWAVGTGTYQLGQFPTGWSEWNGQFRDRTRTLENKLGVTAMPPSSLADAWGGSPSLYTKRSPAASINYVVSHDGFTLRDEFACVGPSNAQAWPYGPSSGGAADETQWNQGGAAADQQQAERVAIALLATSAGVPMITGGDELGRTIQCNDNPYNLDSIGNWLDWPNADPTRTAFVRGAFATRNAHPSLHPAKFRDGQDHNGNGRPDIRWLTALGGAADATYLGNTGETFLAFELDATESGEADAAVMVAYSWGAAAGTWTLPAPPAGTTWRVALDTSKGKATNVYAPAAEPTVTGLSYALGERTVAVLVAR